MWVILCFGFPDLLLSLYAVTDASEETKSAMSMARVLLGFVGIYVLFDATQLIVAGTLRGAGDSWFVLVAASSISMMGVAIGLLSKDFMLSWVSHFAVALVVVCDHGMGTDLGGGHGAAFLDWSLAIDAHGFVKASLTMHPNHEVK